MDAITIDELIDLGTWIGRKQAFGTMAGRCSAADAACLMKLKEEKKNLAVGLSWQEFCPKYLGISRSQADRIIHNFVEFGESFFLLNSLVPITAKDYRVIEGSIGPDGLRMANELIPFEPQQSTRLIEAVDALKQQARPALPAPQPGPEEQRNAAADTAVIWQSVEHVKDSINDLEGALSRGPGDIEPVELALAIGKLNLKIGNLDRLVWR
jgi:hypothetical protein